MAKKWNFRTTVQKGDKTLLFASPDCHDAKSLAGILFQREDVSWVNVVDRNGQVYLRLVKDRQDLTVNVSSDYAPRAFF